MLHLGLEKPLSSQFSQIDWGKWHFLLFKLVAVVLVLCFTNPDVVPRVSLLWLNSKFGTLLPYLAIWALSLVAILICLLQKNPVLRWGAALFFAFATAVHLGYRQASLSELSVYDVVSLWAARHEAERAADRYGVYMMLGLINFIAVTLVFGIGRFDFGRTVNRWITRLYWLPLLPIAAISAILLIKSGGGAQGMPSQLQPYSVSLVSAYRLMNRETLPRQDVTWTPSSASRLEKIVLLVDESVRAEYMSLTPGNRLTPRIASVADKLIDYGTAVSGGNCSHYSNAIIRFLADRDNIAKSANSNPTIWQYAKKAGYRTVFIDGQSGNIRDPSKLQNFMTLAETEMIDSFRVVDGVSAAQADDKVMEIMAQELAKPGPVFIYANKNGAHFPYDMSYDHTAAQFHPTPTELGKETPESFVNAYLNAIAWSVDRLFPALVQTLEKNRAAMIYTSDHGQVVEPGGLTHCQTDAVDPRTGMVPLMLHLPDGPIKEIFATAAPAMRNKTNHFMIAPTVLGFMGYAQTDIKTVYEESLLKPDDRAPAFTVGDIFGLFSDEARWIPVDPDANLMEAEARKALGLAATAAVN